MQDTSDDFSDYEDISNSKIQCLTAKQSLEAEQSILQNCLTS